MTETSASPIETSSRLLELDGIRGIACLVIVIYHFFGLGIDSTGLTGVAFPLAFLSKLSLTSAWSGVDLFFVLSGFLIGGILIDNRGASNYYKVFYIRRFCRILPLYFLVLVLFFGFAYLATPPMSTAARERLFSAHLSPLTYLTFTQNIVMASTDKFGNEWINITWSLAIEEQFYLLLPLIIRLAPPRRLPHLLIAFILAAPLLRLLVVPVWGTLAAYVLMPCRADALMMGVLCAYLVRQPKLLEKLRSLRRQLYGVVGILSLGALILSITAGRHEDSLMMYVGYTCFAILYACFLLIAISERRGPIKFLTRRVSLIRIGMLAYGIYLFHQMVNGLLHGILLRQTPRVNNAADLIITLLSILLTIGLAQLVFSVFEKPFIRFGHRFRYRHLESELSPAPSSQTTTA